MERGLEFVTKWGRNASPFKLAWTYFKLNKTGFADLSDVSERVKIAKALRAKVRDLESSARMLRKAVNEQSAAEAGLPAYPLESASAAGHVMVTADELAYVRKYFNAAAMVANDAMAAAAALTGAINGWDDVVAHAKNTADFTRAAAWDSVTELDLRFQNEGGSFRAFLVDTRDRAAGVESLARLKQYHAADILGMWTPANYQAPSPVEEVPLPADSLSQEPIKESPYPAPDGTTGPILEFWPLAHRSGGTSANPRDLDVSRPAIDLPAVDSSQQAGGSQDLQEFSSPEHSARH